MTITRLISVVIFTIATFAIVKFSYALWQSSSDYAVVSKLSRITAAKTEWIDGTVALSLERSVTQVALSLDEPVPSNFRALIDEQREKSDALFELVKSQIKGFDFLKTREVFLDEVAKYGREIKALRQEVDQLLSKPASERDAKRTKEIPFAIKDEIAKLKNSIEYLRITNKISSSLAQAMLLIQSKAWEVREFGGRARTYYAIATLREEAIPDELTKLIAADQVRAAEAWDVIMHLLVTIDLPTDLSERIEQAGTVYTGSYMDLLGRLDTAMQDGGDTIAYPVTFAEFFDQSNAALGQMSDLATATGKASLLYWENQRESYGQTLYVNIAMLLLLVAITIASTLLIQRRVIRPLKTFGTAVSDLASGKNVDVPGKTRSDEIGMLARSMDEIYSRAVAASRIRNALDSSSTMMMLADNEFNIVYMNAPLDKMLTDAEAKIQADLPDFNAATLVGANIDVFHKNPSHQRNMLEAMTEIHTANLDIGGMSVSLDVSPVFNEEGERLGTVVEWRDLTAELHATKQIDAVVMAALEGDFSKRADLAGAPKLLGEMGERLNQVADAVDTSILEANRVVRAMAEGRLDQRMTGDFRGVFAELRESVDSTIDRLSNLVHEISSTTNSVRLSADDISTSSSELANRAEQQASSLQETAATMEEMSASVRSNANSSSDARSLATNASDRADSGVEIVEGAVSAMNEIETSAAQIKEIITVIDGIAFQTNLLALNAAVEAARAGDAGKGFAVVASEVRSLAQRSAEAARDIRELIETSAAQVSDGVRLVTETGSSLEGIVASISQVRDSIEAIANASAEQASSVEEITSAVSHMDEITQKNSSLSDQSAANAQQLAQGAQKLEELISFFKLANSGQTQDATQSKWVA